MSLDETKKTKMPIMTDRKKKDATDEEIEKYYESLANYYRAIPFDEEQTLKDERYYQMMEKIFVVLSTVKGTIVLNGDKLPQQKGNIYVSNHIGSFDQFYIASALKELPLHYLVKDKVTTWPIRWNLIYKPTGVVVVNQESLNSWRNAKKKLVQYLYNGHDVFIFPEGTRRGENNMGDFSAGVSQVVQESRRPVVTLAIKNSAKLLATQRPIVCVGETIAFDKRDGVRLITKKLQETVYSNYDQIIEYEKTMKRR